MVTSAPLSIKLTVEERAVAQVLAESLGYTLSELIRQGILSDDAQAMFHKRAKARVPDYRGVSQDDLDEMLSSFIRDMNKGKPLAVAPAALFAARGKALYLMLRTIWGGEEKDHAATEAEKRILAVLEKKLAGLRPPAATAPDEDDAEPVKERKSYTHKRHQKGT